MTLLKIKARLMRVAMTLTLLLLTTATAWAVDNVSYRYYDSTNKTFKSGTANGVTAITDQTTTWGTASTDTWYVVNSDATISSRITTAGNVHLILADGCTLTAQAGITVAGNNSLTIYAQSDGESAGTLNATIPSASLYDFPFVSGIGRYNDSSEGRSGGTITIHGGNVIATGYLNGSGIGGNSDGVVTINGGTVTATGDNYGAGIGGASNHSGGTITINGGIVTANGDDGAGIGGGYGSASGIITINGGIVTASSRYGAGIGGGYTSDGGNITISNAVVFAGSLYGTAIGKGENGSDEGTSVTKNSGIIFENSDGEVYGTSFALTENLTIPEGKKLTIPTGTTLIIPLGITLANNGAISNNGTITNNGTVTNNGTFSGNSLAGNGTNDFQVTISSAGDWDNFVTAVSNGTDYSKKLVLLGADITVNTMVGTNNHKFNGSFNGQGHTLTVNYSGSNKYMAPFSYADGAKISNLTVAGTITSYVDGDGTHGGFIGISSGATEFTNCVFAGTITGSTTTNCAGFVGWNTGTIKYTDCLQKGTLALKEESGSATFNRNGNNDFTRTYYINAYGDAQGAQVYTDAPADKIYRSVTAADKANYYMTASVSGILPFYPTSGTVTPVVTAADGTVLTETTDYTVVIKKDNTTMNSLSETGSYTITVSGTGDYSGSQTIPFTVIDNVSYVYYDNGTMKSDTKAANDLTVVTNQTTWGTENQETWYIVSGSVTIPSRITTKGNVHLILADGCTLTAKAGITVGGNNSLTIYGQANGTGTLYACTDETNASYTETIRSGIECDAFACITIHGGIINAKGGSWAAGIGGGYNSLMEPNYNSGGVITIYGGHVTAQGGTGIGGGHYGNGGTITISGGTVVATGGDIGAGIGGGDKGDYGGGAGGTITISNAVVFATSKYASAIGKGNKGSDEGTSVTKTSGIIFENSNGEVYGTSFALTENLTIPEGKKLTIPTGTTLIIPSGITLANNGAISNNGTITNNGTIINNGTFSGKTVTGSGTNDFQRIISSTTEWDAFATAVNDGTYDTSGKLIFLSESIEVSTMVGTSEHPFKGSFNGDNKTITMAITDGGEAAALFPYISGATIQNLTLAGSVSGGKHCAALVGYAADNSTNLIEGITVSAAITTNDSHCGGILGHGKKSKTTIKNCVFSGSITGGDHVGVLWGWSDSGCTPTIKNCLEKGTSYTGTNVNPVGLINNWGTVTDTYYLNATIGSPNQNTTRGIQVYTSEQTDFCKKVYTYGETDYYSKESVSFSNVSDIYAYNNAEITITPTIKYGSETLARGTDYTIKLGDTEITADNFTVTEAGTYTLTITGVSPNYYGTATKTFRVLAALAGSGSSDAPYIISSVDDWTAFALNVNSGTNADKCYKLSDDWDNSENAITTMVGTSNYKFKGTFDGNGKTLTVNLSTTSNNCAPFAYVEDAIFKDLTIAGSITTNKRYGASIAAHTDGTTNITHCISTVTITSTVTTSNNDGTDGTHGGFVAVNESNATLYITSCVFKGKMLGGKANSNGGFVGYNNNSGKINYTDCLFAPAEITMSATSSCTFNRNGNNEFTRTYYLTAFGDAQGMQVYPFTTGAESYETVNAADGNTYYYNITPKTVATISTVDDWNDFAGSIYFGNTYDGKTVTLADTWNNSENAITTMAGTNDHKFSGTFDGNNKTLTVNIVGGSNTAALFLYISGATIKDLTVAGSVSGGTHTAGLVGFACDGTSESPNTIDGCTVNVAVSNPATDGNRHIGGVVGHGMTSHLTIKNTVFSGTMWNSYHYAGGLQGWSDGNTLTISNCLFVGRYTGKVGNGFHPVAIHHTGKTTKATVDKCYYTAAPTVNANYIAATGTQVYQLTMPTALPENVTLTATEPTTTYNDVKYYAEGTDITLSHNYTDYTAIYTVTKDGTSETVAVENDQFTMPAANATLTIEWQQNDVEITLTEAYGTFCSDKDLDFSETTGLKAYIAAGFNKANGKLIMLHVTSVPAGTGLLLHGTAGSSYKVKTKASDCIYANLLKGTTVATDITTDDYVLGKVNDVVGFYKASQNGTLAAGKAYLHLPSTTSAPEFLDVQFEEDVTGIVLMSDVRSQKSDVWYTLDGRKLQGKPTQKGLYIHNGKQEVVK